MQLYGNDFIELEVHISEIDGNFVKIWFENYKKETYVPLYLIKNQISQSNSSIYNIKLPIWFLKKQRILPLNNNF